MTSTTSCITPRRGLTRTLGRLYLRSLGGRIAIILLGLLSLLGALAEEQRPPRIAIEAAMREYQARYSFVNGIECQWPECGCTPAPPYPQDKFYGDFVDSPELAVSLVKDLVTKFNGDRLYTVFTRSTNGVENIEGYFAPAYLSPPPTYLYGDPDIPQVEPNSITQTNYADNFNSIYGFIRQLRTIWVSGGVCGVEGAAVPELRTCDAEVDAPYDAKAVATQQWSTNEWGPTYSEAMKILTDAWSYDTRTRAKFEACRGRLFVDLTLPTRHWRENGFSGQAEIYLVVTNQLNGPSPNNSAPVTPDQCYHHYASCGLGGSYLSPSMGEVSGPVWDDYRAWTAVEEHRGWYFIVGGAAVVMDFSHAADPQECGGCGGNCSLGALTVSNAPAYFRVGLGLNKKGNSAGYLMMHERTGSERLYRPAGLRFIPGDGAYEYPPGEIHVPQGVAVIEETPGQTAYTISFYSPSAWPGGSWFKQIRVEQLGGSTNRARVSDTIASVTTTRAEFTYDPASNQWEMIAGPRKDLWASVRTGADRTETRTVYDTAAGQPDRLVYQEVLSYHQFSWGEELASKAAGTGTNTLAWAWRFGTNSAATDSGRLIEYTGPYGEWERYVYDAAGRVTNLLSAWKDVGPTSDPAQCRSQVTLYSNQAPHVTIIDSIQGQEVARRYHVYSENQVEEIICPTPGSSHSDAGNLRTLTTRNAYDGGPEQGQVLSARHADGTMDFHSYSYPGSGYQITTYSGEPNSGKTAVVNGTKTVTVRSEQGETVSSDSWAIVNGQETILLSSHSGDMPDDLGRFQRTRNNLDNTQVTRTFGCCGLTTETDREGVVTGYDYDQLGRLYLTTRNGISTAQTLDALGHALVTTRQGQTGLPITQMRAEYDAAGRQTRLTNALGGVTVVEEAVLGDKLRRTTTYPDAATRVEDFYRDGRPQKITGTAVFSQSHDYGREQDGGVWRAYGREVKLDSSGAETSEWTKTYLDGAGYGYKTTFADGATDQTWRNSNGQLWKRRDLDGVTTLSLYNGQGEAEYAIQAVTSTATNLSDYASLSNTLATLKSGTDRITQTVRSYLAAGSGLPDRTRIETCVWGDNNSSAAKLVSRAESSASGLQNWTTTWAQAGNDATKVVSQTTTSYDLANRKRTVVATAADGTQSVNVYQDGQLQSATRTDATANHNQVTKTTFGYDAQGRQNTSTDARNGTTTYFFNDAGQVSGIVTPAPAPGLAAQGTTNFFTTMGRVWKTTLPDNTSVTNEFYATGLLKKKSGSREYPVEYTYDYAGRTNTMKTWQNFAGDSGAAVTTWNYDACRGFLSSKRYADNTGPDYTYYASGRLKERTWARGNPRLKTTYVYSAAGDLVTVDYADSTPDISYGYDRRGRQTTASQGGATATRTFSDAGSLLSESWSGGALSGLSITNGYDEYLRRTNVVARSAPSTTLSWSEYSYDQASRLSTVSQPGSVYSRPVTASYSYLADSGLVGDIEFATNGVAVATTFKNYDFLNRLTNIATLDAQSAVLSSFAYQYNSANQRTRRTEADSAFWSFGYDTLGQVTSGKKYWADGKPVAGEQFEYAFDDIGNRKSAGAGGDQNGLTLRTALYTANNLNQYTTRTVPGYREVLGSANSNAVVTVWGSDGGSAPVYRRGDYFRAEYRVNNATGAVWLALTNLAVLNTATNDIVTNVVGNAFIPGALETFGHDLDGSLTNDGRWTYTWDGENRLTGMQSLASAPTGSKRKLTFEYDSQGRRVRLGVAQWTNNAWSVTTSNLFVYDGWNVVAELNATNKTVIRSYVWGLDLSGSQQGAGGVGGLLAVYDASTISNQPSTHFVAYDGNGNVMGLVNAADGKLSAQYEFGPFGEVLRKTGAMASAMPFRFSTKYQDDEPDLLYYGDRYYCASTGRWLSKDPVGESGGPNLYGFVKCTPINLVDAFGRCPCQILKPLTITLATPRQLGYLADEGWNDRAVWEGNRSRIWFKMEATFANKCCKFRQRLRSTASVGGRLVEDTGWIDDTDYENGKYEPQSDGTIVFSDWDNPGWNQADQPPTYNPVGEAFTGAKYLEGYVIDVCSTSKSHVGPILFYGMSVTGTPPSISVRPYGFAK